MPVNHNQHASGVRIVWVRTDLRILLLIPGLHEDVNALRVVEVRSVADDAADVVARGEEPLTGLEVFDPEAFLVQAVLLDLAKAIVSVPVKGVHAHLDAGVLRLLPEQGAAAEGALKCAADVCCDIAGSYAGLDDARDRTERILGPVAALARARATVRRLKH